MAENVLHCIQRLVKVVECSICLETMTDPVETRCGHSFCQHCIGKAIEMQAAFKCPLCKETVNKRSLKKSDYLAQVISAMKSLKRTSHMEITGASGSGVSSASQVKQNDKKEQSFSKSIKPLKNVTLKTIRPKTKVLSLSREPEQLTPDLLDFVEAQTPMQYTNLNNDTKSSAAAHIRLTTPSLKIDKGAKGIDSNKATTEDGNKEYDFPLSQPNGKNPLSGKKVRKANTKKSAKRLIWKSRNVNVK
uniref:RING-type domain-containing protein n=1 Tax=Ciona savignyi TaxID=51511 RepID=H2YZX5_CIOSA